MRNECTPIYTAYTVFSHKCEMNELSEHFNYLRLKRVTSLCLLEQLCKNDSIDFHKVLTQGRNDYIFLVLRLCYDVMLCYDYDTVWSTQYSTGSSHTLQHQYTGVHLGPI